jgi:hypothetical protein
LRIGKIAINLSRKPRSISGEFDFSKELGFIASGGPRYREQYGKLAHSGD